MSIYIRAPHKNILGWVGFLVKFKTSQLHTHIYIYIFVEPIN